MGINLSAPSSPRPGGPKQSSAHGQSQERKVVSGGRGHSTLSLCKTKENHSTQIK